MISECVYPSQCKYKQNHDKIAQVTHWNISGRYGLERIEKCYEHITQRSVEIEEVKLLWGIYIQCDSVVESNRPNLLLTNKKENSCIIIGVAIPADVRLHANVMEGIKNIRI